MALSYNDLMTKGVQVAAAATDIVQGPCRLMGLLVHATGAAIATLSIFDATATTGTADITLETVNVDGDSEHIWFGPQGVAISTELNATIANGLGYVFYIAD